jgi:undecaprenyl-diphosphatase
MSLTLASASKKRINTRRAVLTTLLFFAGLIEFIVIYCNVKTHTGLYLLNTPVLEWMVSHRTPALNSIMEIITNAVSPLALAVVVLGTALTGIWHKKEIWRPTLLVGAVGVAFIVSTLIKNIVQNARPATINMVAPFELDYSFPSGHSIGIAVYLFVLGYLLYSRTRSTSHLWIWAGVSVFGIVIIALSRLYLGYHWLTDVSASVGLAAMILAVVMAIDIFKSKRIA